MGNQFLFSKVEWIRPCPWQHKRQADSVSQQLRSAMEVDLYEVLCHLLSTPDVFQKKRDEFFWCEWYEKVACASIKSNYCRLAIVAWLQHFLDYCEEMLQQMNFTIGGIIGVWMRPLAMSKQWEKKWLAQLTSDCDPFLFKNPPHIQHLLHPCWYPIQCFYSNSGVMRWHSSEWDCEKKTWKGMISGLHPCKHKEIYDELNMLIPNTIGMISQSLLPKNFGEAWFSQDDAPLTPHYANPIWACDVDVKEEENLPDLETSPTLTEPLFDFPHALCLSRLTKRLHFFVQITQIKLHPNTKDAVFTVPQIDDTEQEGIDSFVVCVLETKHDATHAFIEFTKPYSPRQFLGKIPLQQNRMLCFSNTFEYQIKYTTCQDSSMVGGFTFLLLSLVHPEHDIYSQSQQEQEQQDYPLHWIIQELSEFFYIDVAQLIAEYTSKWTRQTMQECTEYMDLFQERFPKFSFVESNSESDED